MTVDLRSALLSLAAGVAVGVAYALVGVRSPAPPVVALLGLLGMVAGEGAALAAKARWHAPEAARTDVERPADPKG